MLTTQSRKRVLKIITILLGGVVVLFALSMVIRSATSNGIVEGRIAVLQDIKQDIDHQRWVRGQYVDSTQLPESVVFQLAHDNEESAKQKIDAWKHATTLVNILGSTCTNLVVMFNQHANAVLIQQLESASLPAQIDNRYCYEGKKEDPFVAGTWQRYYK